MVDELNNELWSKVGKGLGNNIIRIPKTHGLAGYVALTGKILNVDDAYGDSRFD